MSNSYDWIIHNITDMSAAIKEERPDISFDKIKHIGNIEYKINQTNAAREFLLKVIEIICGGGFYHEENFSE